MQSTITHIGKRERATQKQVIDSVGAVASELGSTKAILFGSFARGMHTDRSDVDIVFVHRTEERFIDRPIRFMELLYQRIHGRGIDVLVYTPEEFDRLSASGNGFIRRVLREGKVIYES